MAERLQVGVANPKQLWRTVRGSKSVLRRAQRNEHAGEGMRDNGVSPVVQPDLVWSVEARHEHVPRVKVVVIQTRRARSRG